MVRVHIISAFLLSLLVSVLSIQTKAQLDHSSSMLLRKRSSNEKSDRYESDRFTVKQTGKREQGSGDWDRVPLARPEATGAFPSKLPPKVKAEAVATTPAKVSDEAPSKAAANKPAKNPGSSVKKGDIADIADQVKELLFGGDIKSIEEFRKHLSRRDYRLNLLEVSFAPTYSYENASSRQWYRNYHMASPGFSLQTKVWVTPFFGFQASYMSTLGSGIRGNLSGSEHLPVEKNYFDGGLRFRKFFGLSRKAPSLILGVDFIDQELSVPSDASSRVALKTSGLKFMLESWLPHSKRHISILGIEFVPRANHSEEATALEYRSGTTNETSIMGLWFGGQILMDRKNQVFWRLGHRLERNAFTGSASQADPVTGVTYQGVTVDTGTTYFKFGYTWGD